MRKTVAEAVQYNRVVGIATRESYKRYEEAEPLTRRLLELPENGESDALGIGFIATPGVYVSPTRAIVGVPCHPGHCGRRASPRHTMPQAHRAG